MKNKLLLLFVLLFLFSCTPQKRLQRLLKHHPELLQKDTIYLKDTIITKAIQIDTNFIFVNDTFFIEKEKFKIELIKKDKIIYLKAESKADTIYINKPYAVEKIIYKNENKFNIKNKNILFLLLLIVLLVFIYRILIMIFKN